MKDYDMSVLYHSSKDNIVGDALSRLSMGSVSHVEDSKKNLAQEVHQLARLGVSLVDSYLIPHRVAYMFRVVQNHL